MRIPQTVIDDIRARADILRVIEACGTTLQVRGRRATGLCPFHDDHHPSLQVDTQKQLWFCGPCHMGGDVFQFVKLHDHVNFPEAVRRVAAICGLQYLLPEDKP